MKKGNVFAIAMFAGLFTFSSCAMKKDLVNCQKENKELTGNYQTAKEDLAASKARVAALEEQLNASKELLKQQKADYAALQASLDKSLTNAGDNNINISKLVDQINESNQYIRHLVEVKSKSDSLNMVLTNNLTRSLSKEESKEVDVQVLKGVVYISLADNMLYKSGSYEINERASETLSKIAKIITDYKDYEVLIEGNTDNVPVNAKAASMKNIRNNWDLSCLRASSVVQALQNHKAGDIIPLQAGNSFQILKLTGVRDPGEQAQQGVRQTHVRHIMMRPSNVTPEKVVIQRLNEIKSRLDKGDGDFQTLARLHSADPSGTRGGDLGWLYPGDVPPEMEQQLDKLSVGEISEPIRTPYGWHIFQVLDRRTKSGINERQREQAREALREQKLGDAVLDWERRLRSEAYVEKRINKPTE